MKLLKKNQVVIYVIAVMLMAAGYLNYTTNDTENTIQTSMEIESKDDTLMANIGDAKLVSSQDVVPESNVTTENANITQNGTTSNETSAEPSSLSTNEIPNEKSKETNSAVANDDYFSKSKLERDTMYSQMLETYEKVLNSTNSLETQKQSATQEITKINETKNCIMICENLIKTKGFDKSIIFVNGDSISVIIGASELKQEEIAQIQNIIARELRAEIENIHISTK